MNGIFRAARGAALPRLLLGLAALLGTAEALLGAASPVQITEFAAGGRQGLIDEDGNVSNDSTRAFLQHYMTEFHGFIGRVYTVLPRNA